MRSALGFAVNSRDPGVIRARTPPRGPISVDARDILWTLTRSGAAEIRVELIALTDAVELETLSDDRVRRRVRLLRDSGGSKYAQRLYDRLVRRRYELAKRTSPKP
jgi:hypothetical protein